jgi:tetratricopeptide (TPR) repeat protein
VSRSRLRYWERTALFESDTVGESGDASSAREEFEFLDLVTVRSLLALIDRGVSLRRIRRSIQALRERIPGCARPLSSLRPWMDGSRRVVVRYDGVLVEPDGQLVLDFGTPKPTPAVDLCPVPVEVLSEQQAIDWFEQGCKLDANRTTFGEAIDAYQRAIECDPDFADAHCNLGSVYFNQDRLASSRECFTRALECNPRHVEANLNLATLLEEEGRDHVALRHYKTALESDPLGADIHVSLALLYEKIGLRRKARGHWRHYLQLEPSGTWIEIARQRLER